MATIFVGLLLCCIGYKYVYFFLVRARVHVSLAVLVRMGQAG